MFYRPSMCLLTGASLLCMVLAGLYIHDRSASQTVAAHEPSESRKVLTWTSPSVRREAATSAAGPSSQEIAAVDQAASPVEREDIDVMTRSRAMWRDQLPEVDRLIGLDPQEDVQLLTLNPGFHV